MIHPMRRLVVIAAVAGLLFTVGSTVQPPDSALAAHKCRAVGSLHVTAEHVTCRFARRWTRRYTKHGKKPKGWTCYKQPLPPGTPADQPGSAFGQCKKGSRVFRWTN
jgi:hypothetical protein